MVFSSLRLMRRPLLILVQLTRGTSWPSRNRNGQSRGALEVLVFFFPGMGACPGFSFRLADLRSLYRPPGAKDAAD